MRAPSLQSLRLTDVLSRIRFDVMSALQPRNGDALAVAALICACCTRHRQCGVWISGHREGEDNAAPAFCPNRDFMRAHEPPRERARARHGTARRRRASSGAGQA